jgi:hypothetical protein
MHELTPLTGSVASSVAGVGQRSRVTPQRSDSPPLRLASRDTLETQANEQLLIDRIEQLVAATGASFPRWLIVNYLVSLKTNTLVVLVGAEQTGKADFSRIVATALFGSESIQFAMIPGRVGWHAGTGEGSYYRTIHERFSSLRFLELLQDAAAPMNAGRLFLACFQHLHPAEIETYFTSMLAIGPKGEWRVQTPGVPLDQQPIIPPNVRITATVDTPHTPGVLSSVALSHAGVIDFATPLVRRLTLPHELPALPPGIQRLWLRGALRDTSTARQRLAQILGHETLNNLRPSASIRHALWQNGLALHGPMLHELTLAVANSFDQYGHGLFDPQNPYRNAQIAYDTHLIQRLRWQSTASTCPSLSEYFADPIDRDPPPNRRVA